jgi:hypothetical protein
VSQQTTNRSFDELARALAEGSLSRRRALKLFAGTALAALIPSRALADDDCVRVCHVPFDRVTEECDFANAETRCVSRRERRRHLENHPCDCRGRCANCLTPPAEPICNPPCPQGRECVEGAPGFTFCQPICPSCACSCFDLPDGSGGACVACNGGCPSAPNNDCSRCETDFPGTICVLKPASTTDHLCCQPASPPPP